MRKTLPSGALLFLIVLAQTALPAFAGRCPTPRALLGLREAIQTKIECGRRDLRGLEPSECRVRAAPGCALEAERALMDLAFGGVGAPVRSERVSLGVQRCQAEVARAVERFAFYRLRERAAGARRTRAGRIPEVLIRSCDGVTVESDGVRRWPQFGGPCAPLSGSVGQKVHGAGLARCVRASVEQIVDAVSPSPLRPNIVLVLTDDQRWDTMGYMPATLERLGGRGLAFQNAFATTPACSPSRASIYTGLHARRHGVDFNGREPRLDPSTTLAPALARAGYTNGFFGKYLNGAERLGPEAPPGWHAWQVFQEPAGGSYSGSRLNRDGNLTTLEDGVYSTDFLAREATRFLRANASRPFFLVYAPFAPHGPSQPAPRHRDFWKDLPPHRPPNWRQQEIARKPDWVRFLARVADPERFWVHDRRHRNELETLLAVDEAVLELTDALERAGLTDQTLFVYTSDHGIHWGEHWNETKFSAYEESIRVPYLLRYPSRVPLPRAVPELVANIDLAPTFAALAGASLRGDRDGVSLLPLMTGTNDAPPPTWRDAIAIESPGGLIVSPSRALRTQHWKYIETDASQGVRRELYDLIRDPWELVNHASDPEYAATLSELAARLQAVLPLPVPPRWFGAAAGR